MVVWASQSTVWRECLVAIMPGKIEYSDIKKFGELVYNPIGIYVLFHSLLIEGWFLNKW